MRIKRGSLVAGAVAALLAVGAGSAQADLGAPSTLAEVDTAKAAQYLHSSLNGKAMGYAFAIAEDGLLAQKGSDGTARVDKGTSFTPNSRIEIASATKNVVAAALLKVTEAAGLTPDALIWPYLPPDMRSTATAGWQSVKIKDILGHTSGLGQFIGSQPKSEQDKMNARYDGIKYAMSVAPVGTGQAYDYENENYAVARVVLTRLWYLTETDPSVGVPQWIQPGGAPWSLAYINRYLFKPAGIAAVDCLSADPQNDALGHMTRTSQTGNLLEMSGVAYEACASYRGLRMSAIDLVRWQVYLRHGTIVSQQVRLWMDTVETGAKGLGWTYVANGTRAHGGDYNNTLGRVVTCHGKFTDNVEASLVVNSGIDGGANPCSLLAAAIQYASS
ncbi:serine hydrolase domain-containing protein [Saccharothrix variisporea]|uniref:CubicO group peptidase (Beta-lactamase class C family) n=1 Tax=Saccharothrix variisporea TaxID=543527 RepID=A0A495XHI0_9PSEU|nr:serine hydrolase domain-containing protein [Saccharothrix variisporea]RKT72636.1 CubicO group peptidase (beta-lactamase class C family) [Saccharothrix variisporea]